MEPVYVEINNWGTNDYPQNRSGRDLLRLCENFYMKSVLLFLKKIGLCVVGSHVDMSNNYCITMSEETAKIYFPELFEPESTKFLRYGVGEEAPIGKFGCPFLELKPKNYGMWVSEKKDTEDEQYSYWTAPELPWLLKELEGGGRKRKRESMTLDIIKAINRPINFVVIGRAEYYIKIGTVFLATRTV